MRRRVLRVVTVGYVIAVCIFLGRALVQNAAETSAALSQVGWLGVAESTVATVVGVGLTGQAWRRLLAGLGHPLDRRSAAGVFFVAQVGKYLPGAVWPYVAQVRLAGRHRVPASRSAAAGAGFMALHVATGLLLGVALVGGDRLGLPAGGLLLAAAGLLVLLHPAVSGRLLALAERRLGGVPDAGRPSGTAVLASAGWLLAAWACYGVGLWALTGPVSESTGGLLQATGSFALAWVLGFVGAAVTVVLAPAGFGIREAVLIVLLTPVLPPGTAPAVAVLSRGVHMAADATWALVGASVGRRADSAAP